MSRLRDCLDKVLSGKLKLISQEDANFIIQKAASYEADGDTPIVAARAAVNEMIANTQAAGEHVIEQIATQRPDAHQAAVDFWNRETIQKAQPLKVRSPKVQVPAATPPVAEVPAALPAEAAPAEPVAEFPPAVEVTPPEVAAPAEPAPAEPPPLPERAPGEPPPLPEPLNAQAESVIAAAPVEEQPAMRAAFKEDTSPDPHEPLKDYGQNLPPEENTELLDELSKYGAFKPGATARSVMEALAADKSQPKWVRTIMALLLKVGAAKNLGFKIVNRPDSHWSALYVQDTKEILINLGHKPVTSLAKTFAHEVLHHLTLSKLAGDESLLSTTEVIAKRALEKIFNDIKNRPEFKGAYGTKNLWEFASEVFSNEELRKKLNNIISENSRFSVMQLWRRFTAALGFGDEGVKVGGYLDEAMRQTMNVAGVSAGTSVSELVAPIQRALGFVAPLAKQALTSADTSIPQVAAAMKKIPWERGTRNLDLGGGKHDLGTNYLKTQGVRNLLYDPFNRTEKHNERVLKEAAAKGIDSVTVLNVLNVIREPEHRDAVIKQAADHAGNDKPAYFQVYEGNGSGVGKETIKGWQNNRKLSDYVAEIGKHFSQVERHGIYLEARNPDPGLVARDAKVAQDAKEFPAFAPETARLSAPLTAASEDAERHVMEHERIKSRVFDTANATYSPAERSDMNTALNNLIEKKGLKISKAEKAQLQKTIETQVRDMRAKFAASQNWMQDKIKPIGIEELKQNKKTGEWMVKTEFKGIDYTFDRDTEGNFFQRDTPEWEGRVEDMAEKGSEEILNLVNKGGKIANTIMEQKGWYREMTAYLRNVFGGMSDLMADFLGTFSPRTDMEHTWIYSMQALQKLIRGDYDELMAEFDAHIRDGGTPEQWRDAGKPMIMRPGAEEGKEALFGVNSIHGMVAMLDMWRRIDKGSSPKARNFTANLIGLSMKATIDMWAARFLQRMAHPNQRVPTTMEGGVAGEHMKNIELVDKGFGLGQDVFDRMVEKLKAKDPERFADLTSPDLQAVLWFVEKEIWEKEGWTAVRGAANSARALAAAEGVRRFVAGVPNERKDSLVNVSHNMAQGLELQAELHKDEKVIGANVQDTHAIHNGERQRSFDAEWLAHAEYNPEKTVKDLARMAHTLDRDGTYISRIIHDDDEVNPNATSGLTIFLKKQATPEDLKAFEAKLKKLGIDNAVLQVDPRVKPGELGPDRYNGVRIQFLPKFGKATEAKFTKTLAKVRSAFASDPSVALVDTVRYDTLTLKKGEYDATGELTSAAARERGAAWTERSRVAGAKAADIRDRAKAVIIASREEAKRIKRESKKLEAAEDAARLAALSGGVEGAGEVAGAEAGVTSAPLAPTAEEEPTQDSTDVVAAPLSPMGKLSRFFVGGSTTATTGTYRVGGVLSAGGNFTKKIYQAILRGQQNGKATIRRAEYLVNKLNSTMVANYGKDWAQTISEAHRRLLNTALGNVDNRLTEAQSKTANKLIDRAAQTSYKQKVAYAQTIGDPEVRAAYIAKARADYDAANEAARDAYRIKARSENVAAFRIAQANALASLPPELRDIVVQMNDVVTDLSISMMWLRGKGGVSTNMRAAIAENIGTYLHRSYDIFDDNTKWLEFIKGTDPKAQQIVANAKVVFERDLIAREARRFAKEMREAGTPVTRPQAIAHATSVITANDVESMLSDYLSTGDKDPFTRRISLMGGEIPGKAGTAIVTERGQIPKEIQELWGVQHDIAKNFEKTYVPMARFLEKKSFQDFLLSDGIKEGYVWKEGVSSGVTHPPDFVPLKPSGAQTMGLLDGVYVVPELANAYKVMTTQEVMNQTDTWIKQLVGYTLVAKTRLSLVSTERNLLGNILINMANGNFFRNPAEMTKAIFASGQIIKSEMSTEDGFRWLGQTTEETQKMIERGTELGVFGESVNANVLSKVVDTMKKSNGDFTNMDIATLRPLRENIARFTGKTYTLADDAAKMYSWQSEMEKLRWAYEGQNVSEAQIEEEAAQIVRQTTPTYSEAWMLSKWFTGGVGKYVAPFIMFKLEMIRSTWGIFQQAKEEIKSPNARIRGLGYIRLGSLLVTTFLVPAAAASLTKWLWDYDDDDEEALRRGLPDYQRNNMLLFGPKMDGKPSYIDLGFMNPYSALPTGTPLLAALRAYHETQDPEEGAINFLVAGVREFLTPFTSEQLLFQGIEDVYRNQDSRRNKQQLYNPQAPLNERAGIIVDRLWHTVSPGTLDSLERVARGVAGQETPSGRAYDWRAEASSMIAGTKWQVYDPAQGLQSQTAGFESQKKDAGNLFNQPFTIRGTIRPGDVYDGYNHANAARKRLFYDMRQKFLGGISLGMTRAQAIRAMEIGYGTEIRAAGLGNADMAQILNGKYYKYVPSTPAINDAYRNHPERYSEFMKAFHEAPAIEDISK
jgi:hypothetical protein